MGTFVVLVAVMPPHPLPTYLVPLCRPFELAPKVEKFALRPHLPFMDWITYRESLKSWTFEGSLRDAKAIIAARISNVGL